MIPIRALRPKGKGDYLPLSKVVVQHPEGKALASHFYSGGKQKTLRVKTSAGFELEGTLEHPVWIMTTQGTQEWRQLSDLKLGGYVAINRDQSLFGNDELEKFNAAPRSSYCHTRHPNLPSKLDTETAYIIGQLVGDGCMTAKSGRIGFTTADSATLAAFRSWAKQLGVNVNKATGVYGYYISNVYLKEWFGWLGLGVAKSTDKEIPWRILQSSRSVLRAFLQGLFDADAHAKKKDGYIEYSTSSEKLGKQVQIALLQFGVVARRLKRKGSKNWRIFLRGYDASHFYHAIGFRLARKQERRQRLPQSRNSNHDVVPHVLSNFARRPLPSRVWIEYGPYLRGEANPTYEKFDSFPFSIPDKEKILATHFFWDRVIGVEKAEAEVYDLTVPKGHAFIANGFVSHNTHLAAAAANYLNSNGHLVIMITAPDFLDYLKEAFRPNAPDSAPSRLRRVREAEILVLDDLGVEYNKRNGGGTTWAQEQFYKLLDYRYRMGMPTFITTNVPLDRQESRLASRMQDHQMCRVIHNPAPDYRRRKRT
jgi:intein/homing endonuclease